MIIADIPPVSYVQEVRFEYLNEEINFNAYGYVTSEERTGLLFLRQANRFVELSKNTDFNKAELNYERMALINFQAYLQRLGK